MNDLTDEEIKALRKLLPYADDLAEEAKYQRSKTVVWHHWKAVVISFAAFLAATLLVWDKGKAFVTWILR